MSASVDVHANFVGSGQTAVSVVAELLLELAGVLEPALPVDAELPLESEPPPVVLAGLLEPTGLETLDDAPVLPPDGDP
ncbi:MAG: hypothetical protein FWD17_17590 [Polyangiaceae bacterium]|nr:hypothetical protein [Polyangiaceae bacterium]